jgi:hypothetical protein
MTLIINSKYISFSILLVFALNTDYCAAQNNFPAHYEQTVFASLKDSLRLQYGDKLFYKNKKEMELATLLAISHYPELTNRNVHVILKNVKGAPVEASFSPFNFLKRKEKKVYKIIIQENSFMETLSLNKQVAALGHEMAHFIQYEKKGYLGTLFTLIGYVASNKIRLRFEKEADKIGIDHGLGPHMLDFSFYTSDEDIKSYMDQKGYIY